MRCAPEFSNRHCAVLLSGREACLHGQETAEGAAIRIALPEGRGVTGGGIGLGRASGSGYRCGGGADSKHDGVKWFSHGFSSSSGSLPQRRAADQ